MKRTLIAATAMLALAACQREPQVDDTDAAAAQDAAVEASASAGAASDAGAARDATGAEGVGPAAAGDGSDGRAIGAPPPINGASGAATAEAGGAVRPEMGGRMPEEPTTGSLARPDTPMPDTTPDGRPAL